MAKKSSTAKARLFKIVQRWRGWTTTRLYQSKATFDRSWKHPFLSYLDAQYDAYELKNNTWIHIGTKT